MKPVDVVKVNELIPIFKNGEEANAIQVARISELESATSCQFNIIVGKGLYNIGDKVVYIQPDYCIPDVLLFKEYYAPNGDIKKSKLGSRGRIKAVKFNFTFKDEFDPIYSNGIILPKNLLNLELTEDVDLMKELGVVKYVAEDSFEGAAHGLTKGDLPSYLYATDEDRIELKKEIADRCFKDNEILSFTIKRDGSSITLAMKLNEGEYDPAICSRKQEKKIEEKLVNGYKTSEGISLVKYFNKSKFLISLSLKNSLNNSIFLLLNLLVLFVNKK